MKREIALFIELYAIELLYPIAQCQVFEIEHGVLGLSDVSLYGELLTLLLASTENEREYKKGKELSFHCHNTICKAKVANIS